MIKRRIVIDVSNLSTDPKIWKRTGIQEYNFRTLESYLELRATFPDWEIILHPRFRIWGLETNSAHILAQVEEKLGKPSEEIWGYDLRKRKFYTNEKFTRSLTAEASHLHIQSILDFKDLLRHKIITPCTRRNSAILFDLIPIYFPEYFGGSFGHWYATNYLDAMANCVSEQICISRSTAIDLSNYYNRSNGPKISYLQIPAQLESGPTQNNPYGDFLLSVGSFEPRKNLLPLIRGWEIYRQYFAHSKLKLVLVGGTGWLNSDIFKKINASPMRKDIILPGYASDAQLASLMQQAQAVAMLSLYEGLGLPLVQAHHFGTPLITHLGSSLPEACSTEAIFVDPSDPYSVAAGIRNVRQNTNKQEDLAGWREYTYAILERLLSDNVQNNSKAA